MEKKVRNHVLYSKPSKGWIDSNATSILTQMDKEPGWIVESADKGGAVVLWGRVLISRGVTDSCLTNNFMSQLTMLTAISWLEN